MISRRCLLLAAAATLTAGSGFGYMRYWEPGWLELTHQRIAFFKDKAAPFKILFLADLHYSRFVPLSLISDAIALGIEQKPDLILLGGDYVLFDMPLNFSAFSNVLSPLAECAPTFACFGNHDRPVGTEKNHLIGETLKSVGITVLFNQSRILLNMRYNGGQPAEIRGTDAQQNTCDRQYGYRQHQRFTDLLQVSKCILKHN